MSDPPPSFGDLTGGIILPSDFFVVIFANECMRDESTGSLRSLCLGLTAPQQALLVARLGQDNWIMMVFLGLEDGVYLLLLELFITICRVDALFLTLLGPDDHSLAAPGTSLS